jgi:hypothetical protein
MSDLIDQEWNWYWGQVNGEADCGIYTETRLGCAYAICRCPRYLTEEQWAAFAAHICDLHNASIKMLAETQ